jgi:hypothetical protein
LNYGAGLVLEPVRRRLASIKRAKTAALAQEGELRRPVIEHPPDDPAEELVSASPAVPVSLGSGWPGADASMIRVWPPSFVGLPASCSTGIDPSTTPPASPLSAPFVTHPFVWHVSPAWQAVAVPHVWQPPGVIPVHARRSPFWHSEAPGSHASEHAGEAQTVPVQVCPVGHATEPDQVLQGELP